MSQKDKCREWGEQRINVARKAKTKEDWGRLWKKPSYPYLFEFGSCWKNCIEYKVKDFSAEVGFFIDVLGLVPNAFSPEYAMFTSPDGDFFFSVIPSGNETPTAHDAIRIQFMLEGIQEVTSQLKKRGIEFEIEPAPQNADSPMYTGTFYTPNGIPIDLWGIVENQQ